VRSSYATANRFLAVIDELSEEELDRLPGAQPLKNRKSE
jgi:hypothetical protein